MKEDSIPDYMKRASVSVCNELVAKSFMMYLSGLRQQNRLPDYAYKGIPITVRGMPDDRYDVYVSLGDNQFVFYKELGYASFKRFTGISVE